MPDFHHADLFKKNPKLLNGNLQIIACAGSGKTEFVSERIAWQIYKGIAKPEQIVAFTFTDKASEELKFRIRSKIKTLIGKQPDIGDIYIGTIHAFAFRLLQEFIPRYRAYDMLDDVGRLAFISSIRYDIDLAYLTGSLEKRFRKPFSKNKQNWVFKTFIRDIDIFREEGLTPDKAVSDSFRNAYATYLQKLDEKRFLDFSAILRIAVDTLKSDKKVRAKVQAQYAFFTVDEYQDVNPIQEELIQLISNKENVCIVGDDDQSIYQWRGADTKNILTFKKRYKNVTTHELLINRRSHDAIVKASSDLITANTPRIPKTIKDKGTASQKGDLYKIVFPHQEDEIEWIVDKIQTLVGTEFKDGESVRKLKYSDFTLLFRSIANESTPYIDALDEADIPTVYSGVGGLFATNEVSGIIRILEYISECDKDIAYDDTFLKAIHNDLKDIFTIPWKQFKVGVDKLKVWAKGVKRLSLQALYNSILNLLNLADAAFHSANNEVHLYNLGRLSQAISDYENSREYLTFKSIKDFIWFIRLHAENSYDSGNNPGIVPQLGFGKQVHNIINLLHKEYEDTSKIPSKKRLQELLDEHFYLRYASEQVTESLKLGAKSTLERYVKMWEADFSLSVKTERAFELEFDNALIVGSIDMIKRNGADEEILEIIDFKTGKANPDLAERYDLQVQLYTIAARDALGINTKKALIHYLDTVKNARVIVETSDYALQNATEQIQYAVNGITTASFKRDARKNDICKGCDWCGICPKKKGYLE